MSDLRELYQTTILDHNKKPRNFRTLPEANRKADGWNPLFRNDRTYNFTVNTTWIKGRHEVRFNLALVLERLGRAREAKEHYRQGLRLATDRGDAATARRFEAELRRSSSTPSR